MDDRKDKDELFADALETIYISSDFNSYQQTGRSLIADALRAIGQNEEEIEEQMNFYGPAAAQTAQAYLECFEVFHADDEFEHWVEQTNIKEHAKNILAILVPSYEDYVDKLLDMEKGRH